MGSGVRSVSRASDDTSARCARVTDRATVHMPATRSPEPSLEDAQARAGQVDLQADFDVHARMITDVHRPAAHDADDRCDARKTRFRLARCGVGRTELSSECLSQLCLAHSRGLLKINGGAVSFQT